MLNKSLIIKENLVKYYIFSQKAGAKNLLFLHGWRSNGMIWKQLAEKFTQSGYSVYAIDLPGFGESSIPKYAFGINDYAQIVQEFIQKIGLKKVILIGHSFGGRIAIKLTAHESYLVDCLVLIDSAGFVDMRKKSYEVYAKMVKPLFRLSILKKVRENIYRKIGAEDYVETPYLRDTFVKIINEDLSDDMKIISVKTLLIWGENDNDTPVIYGQRMREIISNSQLVVLPQAGHFSFIDKPNDCLNQINRFIHSYE